MRIWFIYIKKSYDPEYPEGHVIVSPKLDPYAYKGEEKVMEVANVKTGEVKKVAKVVGLGYADFRDEEDYKQRIWDVIRKKLEEVGIKVGEEGEGK